MSAGGVTGNGSEVPSGIVNDKIKTQEMKTRSALTNVKWIQF